MKRDTRSIRQLQVRYQDSERIQALRALLMNPLMLPDHELFPAVLRHADALRTWFARETGWPLQIERDCARLYKRPADLQDASRGLPGFDRRRYILLCLVGAVLERADPQITLRILGTQLLTQAADPALAERGFQFTLESVHERRELVSVCRYLLDLGVLQRVAGDEEGFIRVGAETPSEGSDALYDVQRRALAGLLAAVRGPSTWPPDQSPDTLARRLSSLVREYMPDSQEGQRTAVRHHLARRLLDDPAVYLESLTDEQRGYFINQRGAMATRLAEATALAPEQRAEGLALIDMDGELSDIALPAEGTEAHVTLLTAEFLARGTLHQQTAGAAPVNDSPAAQGAGDDAAPILRLDVARHLAQCRERFGRYWRKSARQPGAEHELAQLALTRLAHLQLLRLDGDRIHPLPALARFAMADAQTRPADDRRARRRSPPAAQTDLFA